ncbi:MAG: hypothetical protein K0R29_227 [Pseudobdellovibrio sp.]|nr:hypothetical protein [Pseudobdellovibrio sp.]
MPFYDVALVGGGGFVAGHLLESFKLNGQRCLVLSRIRPSSVLPENFIQLDLAQQTLAEALTQHPDVRFKTLIFNSAIKARYEKSTPEWHQQGLITAPEFMGLPSFERLITIGSSEEYGPYADASEITEDAPAKTASSYGYWKLKLLENGRRWANNTGGQHIHLRPFNIIGPGADPKMLAGAVIRALLENKEFKMTAGDQYRSFTSVSTLVNTVQALLTAAFLLQKKINSGQVVFGAVPYRDDEVWHQNPSLNKLKQLLGDNYYAPIEKTLDEMIASIRSGAQPS